MDVAYTLYAVGSILIAVAGIKAESEWTVLAAACFLIGTLVMATQ